MDEAIASILSTFLIDLVLFVLLVGLFLYFRNYRSLSGSKFGIENLHRTLFRESEFPFLEACMKVYTFKPPEIKENLGFQSYIYLQFLRDILLGVTIMAGLGLTILVPIYYTGKGSKNPELESLSIMTVMDSRDDLLVAAGFVVLFSLVLYYIAYKYYKESSQEELNPESIELFAIKVKGLPKDIPAAEMQQDFNSIIMSQFSTDMIEMTYVVSNYTKSYKLHKEILKTEQKIQHYENYHNKRGERHRKFSLRHGSYDTLDYYRAHLHQLKPNFEKSLDQASRSSLGLAFIICKTSASRQFIMRNFQRIDERLDCRNWKLSDAPHPSEIQWEHLGASKLKVWKRVFMYLLFAVIFLVFLTPSGILHYLTRLFQGLGMHDFYERMLSSWLAPLLIYIYNTKVLPRFLYFLLKEEKHSTISYETLSGFRKLCIFMIFYSFLVPVLGLSFMHMILGIYEQGARAWAYSLARGISTSGLFFTNFLIHQAFLNTGLQILDPERLIWIKWQERKAVDKLEKTLAHEAPEFGWPFQYASVVTNLMIVLSLSVAFPMILGVGVVYFWLEMYSMKYCLMFYYCVDRNSPGRGLVKPLLRSLILCTLVFQIITGSILLMSDFDLVIGTGTLIIILAEVSYLVMYLHIEKVIRRVEKMIWDKTEYSNLTDRLVRGNPLDYIHPLEKGTQDMKSLKITA
jgi:hypothetical protein